MDFIRVENIDGTYSEVSCKSGKCSCGKSACQHLERYEEIFVSKNRKLLWLALSAMHKEIRRGEVQLAANWARIYVRLTSAKALRAYCRRLVFEETRSFDLFARSANLEIDPLCLVTGLAAKTKKWEPRCLENHFSNWIEGYKRFASSSDAENLRLLDSLERGLDIVDCYRVLFFIRRAKPLRRDFWRRIRTIAEERSNQLLVDFFRSGDGSTYEAMAGLEMLFGNLDVRECEVTRAVPKALDFFLPALRVHHFDIHTSQGKRRFLKHRDEILKGKFPPQEELDLSASGQIYGVAWRVAAFKEFGSELFSRRWDEVALPGSFEDIIALDKYYYSSKGIYT